MLERYKIRLKVTGPVCIGSGKQINNSNFALEKMPVHLENSIKTGNKIA